MLLCLLLGGLAEGLGLATLLPVISIALGGDAEEEPDSSVAMVADALAWLGVPTEVLPLMTIAVGAIVLKNVLNLAAMTYVGYSIAHIATAMRRDLVDNLLKVRWSYFTQQPLGRITNALSADATRAGQAYQSAATFIVLALQSAVYAILALFVSWKVAVAAIVLGGIIAALLGIFVSMAKKAGRRQTRHTSEFITYLSDALNNIKPLKAMDRQEHFARLLDRNIVGLRRALRRQVIARQAMRNVDEILTAVGLGFGFVFAVTRWDIAPAELAVIGIVLIQLVNSLGKIQKEYQVAATYESAYYNVLDRIEESRAERERDDGREAPVFDRSCDLVGVSFAHPGKPVLRGVSLSFPKDATTVLTGPSGSGKTTIVDLLIGFLTPDEGEVLIDGKPLREFSLHRWRSMIGYVPQELVLFHDTVLANISLGDPFVAEDDVRVALEMAGALKFVEAMPDGLHTHVGEKGTKLSGGQRQRIALARALVKKPRILVLDEVTSALDPETEREIVENIRTLRGGCTVIAITHRPAFLDIADQVYHLGDGRVIDSSAPGRNPTAPPANART